MSAPQRFSMTMGETEHLEETVTEQHVESPRTTEYLPTAEHAQERAVEVDQTLAPAPERIVCEFPPLDEVALHRARTRQDQDDEELSRETENVHSQVNEQPQEEFIVESTPLDEMALRHSRHASIDLSPEHLPDIREETRAEKRQGEREELQSPSRMRKSTTRVYSTNRPSALSVSFLLSTRSPFSVSARKRWTISSLNKSSERKTKRLHWSWTLITLE